jgi:hypothetical protein
MFPSFEIRETLTPELNANGNRVDGNVIAEDRRVFAPGFLLGVPVKPMNFLASRLCGLRHRNIQVRAETNDATVPEFLKEHVVAFR